MMGAHPQLATMLVVDASVAVKLLVQEPGSDAATALLDGSEPLVAPDWVLAEVPNALWKKVAREGLPEAVAREAIDALPVFFVRLYPTMDLLRASYELMFRLQHALYDCFYLALAEREDVSMITADKAFLKAAATAGRQGRVRVLT